MQQARSGFRLGFSALWQGQVGLKQAAGPRSPARARGLMLRVLTGPGFPPGLAFPTLGVHPALVRGPVSRP
eukprot:16428548-Heterocapsa_arctica.AAC.1